MIIADRMKVDIVQSTVNSLHDSDSENIARKLLPQKKKLATIFFSIILENEE